MTVLSETFLRVHAGSETDFHNFTGDNGLLIISPRTIAGISSSSSKPEGSVAFVELFPSTRRKLLGSPSARIGSSCSQPPQDGPNTRYRANTRSAARLYISPSNI